MKPRPIPSSMVMFVMLLALSASAHSATITATYYFKAMDFEPSAPQTIVNGSFTATFTTISGNGTNMDVTLNEIQMDILGHQYHNGNTGIVLRNGRLIYNADYEGNFSIGGNANGVELGAIRTNDFWMNFMDFGSDNTINGKFTYWVPGSGTSFQAKTVTISRTKPLPIAGSIWLLGSGLIALSMAGIRRRRTA